MEQDFFVLSFRRDEIGYDGSANKAALKIIWSD